jgi:hypothetical protein
MPAVLFALVIFGIGSHFLPRPALLFIHPHNWHDRCMPPHSAISWDEVSQTFCLGRRLTVILPISASWVARIIGMSNSTQPPFFLMVSLYSDSLELKSVGPLLFLTPESSCTVLMMSQNLCLPLLYHHCLCLEPHHHLLRPMHNALTALSTSTFPTHQFMFCTSDSQMQTSGHTSELGF